jgi:hypothetical protein
MRMLRVKSQIDTILFHLLSKQRRSTLQSYTLRRTLNVKYVDPYNIN